MNDLWVIGVSNPLEPVPLTTHVTVMTRSIAGIESPSPPAPSADITLDLANPVRGRPEIRLELANPAPVNVQILDILGRNCARLYDGQPESTLYVSLVEIACARHLSS